MCVCVCVKNSLVYIFFCKVAQSAAALINYKTYCVFNDRYMAIPRRKKK